MKFNLFMDWFGRNIKFIGAKTMNFKETLLLVSITAIDALCVCFATFKN